MYSSGTATDVSDLLDKLRAFALSNGYTIDSFITDGAGKRLHIHKGSDYFHFRSLIGETSQGLTTGGVTQTGAVCMTAGSGYSGASAWYNQAGVPTYTASGTNYPQASIVAFSGSIPSYHLFYFTGTGYDVIYMVVEYVAGTYQYLVFGTLDKTNYGTWTGGRFFAGPQIQNKIVRNNNVSMFGENPPNWTASSNPQSFVYGSVDSFTGWFYGDTAIGVSALPSNTPRLHDTFRLSTSFWNSAPNSFNTISPLIPIEVFVTRDGSNYTQTTPFSPIGQLPELYWLNITNLEPASVLTISSDTYKVFPFQKKSDNAAYSALNPSNGTGVIGFAIKTN